MPAVSGPHVVSRFVGTSYARGCVFYDPYGRVDVVRMLIRHVIQIPPRHGAIIVIGVWQKKKVIIINCLIKKRTAMDADDLRSVLLLLV